MEPVDVPIPHLSLARILRADEPKAELEDELLEYLTGLCTALGITWNSKAFRAGLENPALPETLLRQLEDFLSVIESMRGAVPRSVVEALDTVIEEIEACNPAFIASLHVSRASGRIPAATVKKRPRA